MPDTQGLLQAFGEVHDNPILLEALLGGLEVA